MASDSRETSRPTSSLVGQALHAVLRRVPESALNRVGASELQASVVPATGAMDDAPDADE